MRKRRSPEFKAQVVQELLNQQKTVSQLAAEYGVHPNQLSRYVQWQRGEFKLSI